MWAEAFGAISQQTPHATPREITLALMDSTTLEEAAQNALTLGEIQRDWDNSTIILTDLPFLLDFQNTQVFNYDGKLNRLKLNSVFA